jgi:hypothetical protein
MLVPIIEQCAEQHIRPILCGAQYDALVAAIKAGDATAAQTTLIKAVRKALAKWTIVEAAKQLPFLPDQEGFRIISNADAVDKYSYGSASMQGAILGLQQGAETAARTYTADLVDFLYQNADDYPLWKNSDCNKANSQESEYPFFTAGPGGVMI